MPLPDALVDLFSIEEQFALGVLYSSGSGSGDERQVGSLCVGGMRCRMYFVLYQRVDDIF